MFEGPMSNLPQLRDTRCPAPYSIESFPPRQVDAARTPPRNAAAEHEAAGPPQILLIGDDAALQYSRCRILESAGYTADSLRSNLVVEELFLRGVELVLLCHTIPEDVATHLVTALARLAPTIPVLHISFLNDELLDRGELTSVPARPAALLDAVAATLAHV